MVYDGMKYIPIELKLHKFTTTFSKNKDCCLLVKRYYLLSLYHHTFLILS